MRVFKDDEMIAEITGTEVGASSSFEEAILHPFMNSYWICFSSFQVWNRGLQEGFTFEALHSGSQFKRTVQASSWCYEFMLRGHVARSCCKGMLQGHGVRSCSSFMFYGRVPRWFIAVMVWGHGQRSHSEVMFPGHGPKSSFSVMFHGHVAW